MNTKMRAGLWLALTGLCAAKATAAEPCWTRAYSAEHLAGHPGQQVTTMQLQLEPPAPDGVAFGMLTIGLRPGAAPAINYEATIICEAQRGDQRTCGVACDGGQFTLTHRSSDGSVLLSNTLGGLSFLECGAIDTAESYWLRSDPEHQLFRLHAC